MDSGNSPGAKNGSHRITPPSSAYWAARLIERKHAEKTLEDRYGQLQERIEEQESQLSALNEALRCASGRPRARWLVGRGPKEDATGRVSASATDQLPLELLRMDVGKLQQHVARQADELQALRTEWRVEAEQRAKARSAGVDPAVGGPVSPRTNAPIDPAMGESLKQQRRALREIQALLRAERDARTLLQRKQGALEEQQTRVVAELEARLEAALDGRIEGTLERILDRALTSHLETHLLRDREELGGLRGAIAEEREARVGLESRLAELLRERETEVAVAGTLERREQEGKALEFQVARLQALSEEIIRERAARTQEDTVLQQAQAELQRRVADHSAVLRSVSGAMDRELAARREGLAQHENGQKRAQRDTADLAKQLRVVSAALEQEVSDRKEATTYLERAQSTFEQRASKHEAALEARECRAADRQVEIDRKLVEAEAAARALRQLVEQEVTDRRGGDAGLERAVAKLDQRLVEQMAAVEMVVRETTEAKTAWEGLRHLTGEMDRRLEEQVAAVQTTEANVEQEIAERQTAVASLVHVQANLEQQVVELATSSRSLERDAGDRRRGEARFEQVCGDIDRRVAEQGDAVRALGTVAEQEVADRKAAVAELQRIHTRVEQQVGELTALVQSLEREIGARKGPEATIVKLQEQVDGRVAECTRELHIVMTRVARATAEHERLQRGLADAERHTVEHDTRLRAVTGALEQEISRRDGLMQALRGLEAWRAECGGRAAPASDLDDASCRDVAIRSAGTLTILEDAGDVEESTAQRDDIQVAMNGIIGLTELGLDTELTPAQREYLERVKSLAEAALAPGRSAGASGVASDDREPEPFRLREHLRDTLKPLLLRGRQKGLKFSCHIAPRVPDQVFGHPGHLRQVIINLVGNAIKFTESGEISVCVDTASQSASVAALLVSVVDTGAGIPLDHQGAVLDALMRTLPGAGTGGLGLSISAELVRLMEGRLWFESDADQGTKFRFTARLGLQEAPRRSWWRLGGRTSRRKGFTSAPRDGRVVLIAEGSAADRGALKDIVESEGSTAVIVADGRGVLAALEHDAFDLILMDLRMPGMDALEAAATIRALEGASTRGMPIVAMGARLSALDERRCQVVGIDRCLAKPVQARRLLAIINELFRASSVPPSVDLEVDG